MNIIIIIIIIMILRNHPAEGHPAGGNLTKAMPYAGTGDGEAWRRRPGGKPAADRSLGGGVNTQGRTYIDIRVAVYMALLEEAMQRAYGPSTWAERVMWRQEDVLAVDSYVREAQAGLMF